MSAVGDIAESLSSLAVSIQSRSCDASALTRALRAAAAALQGVDDTRILDVVRALVERHDVCGLPPPLPQPCVEFSAPLADLDSWSFDVFALPLVGLSTQLSADPPSSDEAAVGEARLEAVAVELVCQSAESLPVSRDAARAFVRAIRAKYAPHPAFHNWYHGVSVAHATHLLLFSEGAQHLSALQKFAAVLAALSHDAGHTGHTNEFEVLTACAASLAHVHADSVLERNSAHILSDALALSGVLRGLSSADAHAVRTTAVSAILGTDMCRHARSVAAAEAADSARLIAGDAHARLELVELIVHTADLSGFSYASHATCVQWSSRIQQEFKATAEEEVRRGLRAADSSSSLADDANASQVGFIRRTVLPLWLGMRRVLGEALDEPLNNIRMNEREFEKKCSGGQ